MVFILIENNKAQLSSNWTKLSFVILLCVLLMSLHSCANYMIVFQVKDLKRQLVSERRRGDKLQERLQEYLQTDPKSPHCKKNLISSFVHLKFVSWMQDFDKAVVVVFYLKQSTNSFEAHLTSASIVTMETRVRWGHGVQLPVAWVERCYPNPLPLNQI